MKEIAQSVTTGSEGYTVPLTVKMASREVMYYLVSEDELEGIGRPSLTGTLLAFFGVFAGVAITCITELSTVQLDTAMRGYFAIGLEVSGILALLMLTLSCVSGWSNHQEKTRRQDRIKARKVELSPKA